MSSRDLIVGSNGFIGSRLKLEFLRRGRLFGEISTQREFLEFLEGPAQFSLFKNIYWCASKVNPASANLNGGLIRDEISSFERFLLVLSESKEIPRIIFLSSGGCTYSGLKSSYSEVDEARGTNTYGIMKIALEEMLFRFSPVSLCLRVGNVYGPGQPIGRSQGVIAEWVHSIQQKNEITLFGEISSYRDYIHIDDLVRCLIILGDKKISGILNVSNGFPTTLEEIYGHLQESWPLEISVKRNAQRQFDRPGYVLDNSKIVEKSNWRPQIEMSHGLSKLLQTPTNFESKV
jgi:UDP-glucose 4-epimerase